MVGSTINFVKTVEQYPCLYNNRIAEYSRKDITEQAWAEVAKKSNDTDYLVIVYVCQSKWKNIRNGFVRSLKLPPEGSSEKHRKPHYLHKELQFIMPFIKAKIDGKHVNKSLELPQDFDDETNSTSEESAYEPTPITSKKRKKSKVEIEVDVDEEPECKKKEGHNPREMFLFSLLPDIERLTDEQMRKFRIKMLLLLEEIQSTSSRERYNDNESSMSIKQERY